MMLKANAGTIQAADAQKPWALRADDARWQPFRLYDHPGRRGVCVRISSGSESAG